MTNSKDTKKRQPTAATLYRHIINYMAATDMKTGDTINDLLDRLKDTIVDEATRR